MLHPYIVMSSASEVIASADVPAIPVSVAAPEGAVPVPKMSKSAQKKLAKRLAAEKKKVRPFTSNTCNCLPLII